MNGKNGIDNKNINQSNSDETERIKAIYDAYHENKEWENRYSIFREEVLYTLQESEFWKIRFLKHAGFADHLSQCRMIDIGAGSGTNILRFIQYGIAPHKITYNDIYIPSVESAKRRLPSEIEFVTGDARDIHKSYDESYDIVHISTVFTSILDENVRCELADRIWRLLKPNGIVLWVDFACNNPKNPNVRKVTQGDLRKLFPKGSINCKRITLAPPLSRRISAIPIMGPHLLRAINLPFLRTHILATIQKQG